MSFTAFPPEVNSGLMYIGDGSASLMQAASAWTGLSSDLSGAAGSVSSVVGGLTSSWQGVTAAKMGAAVAPYTTWLGETSLLAQQMGVQATAQAGLYETAHAAVIPPAVIEANRLQLLTLVATNFFGQNAPAIAANEATYAAYWATDGAVMDSYMAATQANLATLQQPVAPASATADSGQAQAAAAQAVAQNTANNAASNAAPTLDATTTPTYTPGSLGEMLHGLGMQGVDFTSLNTISVDSLASATNLGSVPARFAMTPVSMLMQLARMGQSAGSAGAASAGSLAGNSTSLMESIGQFVDGKLQGAVGTLAGHFSSATQAISAKLANASSLGALRVPEGWSSAASGVTRAAEVLPSAPISAPSISSSGFPGGAFGQALMGAMSGRGMGSVASRVPKMIPRPSSGG